MGSGDGVIESPINFEELPNSRSIVFAPGDFQNKIEIVGFDGGNFAIAAEILVAITTAGSENLRFIRKCTISLISFSTIDTTGGSTGPDIPDDDNMDGGSGDTSSAASTPSSTPNSTSSSSSSSPTI